MKSSPSSLRSVLNRRALLAMPPLAGIGLIAQRMTSAQSPQLETRGDCLDEPALRMLLDFQTGNWDRLPFTREEDVLPEADWVVGVSPEIGALLVPPDWTFLNVWANSFAENGVPEWQAEQMVYPWWAATFIISPDESAAFISVTGGVDGRPYLGAGDLVELAQNTIMGSADEGREVCAALQEQQAGLGMNEVLYTFGSRYGRDLLVCRGWGLQSDVSGPSAGPGTTFNFDVMIGPRRESEELMTDVFMRILWQMLPKSGDGASTPTPSPTPLF